MERTATPARAKAAGNSQASPRTATAPAVDFTEFDATIVEETGESILVVTQSVTNRVRDRRLARNACEMLLKPCFERQHERLAPVLAHRTAFVGPLLLNRAWQLAQDR